MDANDFLRGGCYALALWLHRKTELPLYGLFDDHGEMHHALVGDHEGETFHDARGRVPVACVRTIRGRRCAGEHLREVSVEEVEATRDLALKFGNINPSDRQVAAFARKSAHLRALVEAGPVPAPGPRP